MKEQTGGTTLIIRKTCRHIAESVICSIETKDDNLDVKTLEKRLDVLAIYILLFTTLAIIGLTFGIWQQLLIATAAMATIRIVSGGNHFDSPDLCFTFTTSAIVMSPMLQYLLDDWLNAPIVIVCIIAYTILSPYIISESKSKNILRKLCLLLGIIISFKYSETVLYMFMILTIDLLVRNPKWKPIKRENVK